METGIQKAAAYKHISQQKSLGGWAKIQYYIIADSIIKMMPNLMKTSEYFGTEQIS